MISPQHSAAVVSVVHVCDDSVCSAEMVKALAQALRGTTMENLPESDLRRLATDVRRLMMRSALRPFVLDRSRKG